MAKKQVSVITPNPPICINIIMTNCPKEVKVVATSTGTKPVTQTALVDTNKVFTHEIPSTVQRGNINKPVPIQIIRKKLPARIREDWSVFPRVRSPPKISAIRKVTTTESAEKYGCLKITRNISMPPIPVRKK